MKVRNVINGKGEELEFYTFETIDIVKMGNLLRGFRGWKYYAGKYYSKYIGKTNAGNEDKLQRAIALDMDRFFRQVIIRLIETGDIFIFPNRRIAMAIAQLKTTSKRYRYSVKKGMAYVMCYIVLAPGMFRMIRKNFRVKLSEGLERMLIRKIKEGMKYMTYEQLMSQLGWEYSWPKRKEKDGNI